MSSSFREAAETLSALEVLRTRTLAGTYRRAWAIWLFWVVVYVGSIPVFLSAPYWGIALYWLCAGPIAVAATVVTFRRLPRRDGVVPLERPLARIGGLVIVVAAFAIAAISPVGPWLAVALAIVVLGWVWPRRLAVTMAAGLASAAIVLALALEEREASAATAGTYAAVFAVYALYERKRLNALR
jgi:hypothetical protein